MSADPIIRMSCETCGMTVEVPFDTVGEMYATEFSERHAHVSADSVQGDAKLRGNSGDADATENHTNGRSER